MVQKVRKLRAMGSKKKNIDQIMKSNDNVLNVIIEAMNNVIKECKIIEELFKFKSNNGTKAECIEIIDKCLSKSYFILYKIYKLKINGIKLQEPTKPLRLPIVQRQIDYLSKLSIDNLANETFKLHSKLTNCLPSLKEIYDLTTKKDPYRVKRIRETDL